MPGTTSREHGMDPASASFAPLSPPSHHLIHKWKTDIMMK